MPRFPIVPQRSRAPAAFSNSPRARAADFGGGLGDAVAAFGGEAGEFAQVVEERREREKRQAAREAKRVRDSAEAERLAEEAAAPEPAGEIAREQQRFQEKADRVAEEHRNHPLADQVKLQLEEQRQAWNRNLVAFEARQRVRQDLARADEIAQRWLTQVTDDPARFEEAAAYLFGDDGPVKGLGLRPEAQAAWEGRTFEALLEAQMKRDPARLIADLEAGRWQNRLPGDRRNELLEDARDSLTLIERSQVSESGLRTTGELQALQQSIAQGEAGKAEIRRAEREAHFSPEQLESLKREAETAEIRAHFYRTAQDEHAAALISGSGFDAENAQHRKAAEEFYVATFRDAVRDGADEVTQERLVAAVAKTGYLTRALRQDVTAALLGKDPAKRVAAAALYGRLLETSPELLEQALDPEVRARGGALHRWLDAGLTPEEALRRSEQELPPDGTVPFLDEEETASLQRDLKSLFYSAQPAGHVSGILDLLEQNYLHDLGQGLTPREARRKLRQDAGRVIAKLSRLRSTLAREPAWKAGAGQEPAEGAGLLHRVAAVPLPWVYPPVYGPAQADQDLNAAAARELQRGTGVLLDGVAQLGREMGDFIALERATLFPSYAALLFGHAAVSIGDGEILLGQILEEDDHNSFRLVAIHHPEHGEMTIRQEWDSATERYHSLEVTYLHPETGEPVTDPLPSRHFYDRAEGAGSEAVTPGRNAGPSASPQDPERQARAVPSEDHRPVILPGPSGAPQPAPPQTPFPEGEGRERLPNHTGGDQIGQDERGPVITGFPAQEPEVQIHISPEEREELLKYQALLMANAPTERPELPPGLKGLDLQPAAEGKNPAVWSRPGQIWAPTKKLSVVDNAWEHYVKHRGKFSEVKNIKQYIDKTHAFVNSPPDGVLAKIRKNGDILLYDPKTNTFAIRDVNGVPRTMFRPEDAMEYWNDQ